MTIGWDLFIVVFFAVSMSYIFIVERQQAITIIIATYIAIIATEGIVVVLARLMGGSEAFLASMGIPMDDMLPALAKMFLFALCIIIFISRSGIGVLYSGESGSIMNIVYTALYGFSAAGLIVSTFAVFAAGSGMLDGASLSGNSTLLQLMTLNRDIWFALPAFIIIAVGFVDGDG